MEENEEVIEVTLRFPRRYDPLAIYRPMTVGQIREQGLALMRSQGVKAAYPGGCTIVVTKKIT